MLARGPEQSQGFHNINKIYCQNQQQNWWVLFHIVICLWIPELHIDKLQQVLIT